MRVLYQVLIFLAILIVIAVIWALVYLIKNKKVKPGISCKGKKEKWDSSCSWLMEIKYDPSIAKPKNPLYLLKFEYSKEIGPPVCLPMWYAYRYVDSKTGNYGSMSEWTTSPISAGGKNLPTPPGCTIEETCEFNMPVIGVIEKLENDLTSGIWANVHRYVGDTDQSPLSSKEMEEKSTIIGMLVPFSSGCDGKYAWFDTDNPCKNEDCGMRCDNC